MKIRPLFAAMIALALLGATWQTTGTIALKNDAVIQRCDQDQQHAVIEVPATTVPTTAPTTAPTAGPTTFPTTFPTTAPFGGTVTGFTATNRVGSGPGTGSPGPFGSPNAVSGALGSTPGPVLSSYPGKMYLSLNGDQYVEAVYTSPNPAGPNAVTVTCTK